MEIPETHWSGVISIENAEMFKSGDLVDFGLQVARDGRIWICINGIAFIRFNPNIVPVYVKDKTDKGGDY